MAVERIDTVWDIPAIEKEYTTYLSFLHKSQDELTALFNIIKQFKDSNITTLTQNAEKLAVSMQGTLTSTKAAADQNEKLVQSIQALVAAMENKNSSEKKTQETFAKSKFQNDEQIRDTLKARDALKARTDAVRGESSAMQDLINRYKAQQKVAQDLAASLGIHDKAAVAAAKSAKQLGEQISNINKATGNNAPSTGVGRYAEGIREFAKEAIVAVSAVVGLRSIFDFFKESVTEFSNSQLAATKLTGILSNLGRSKDIDSINRQVKELSERFKTLKPEEITDVFQKLYTYGKLSTNQIHELIPVIIDFAAKQGIDLPEATDVLTRALEGNARGLKTYGINMKDGKDTTERFGLIMEQLGPRVAGFEKLFEDTVPGALKKTKVEIEELQKDIGKDLVPVTKSWFDLIRGEIGGLRILTDYITNLYQTIKGGGNIFDALTTNPEERRVEAEASDERAKKMADYYLNLDKFKDQEKDKQEKLVMVYNSQLKVQLQQYDIAKKNAAKTGENVGELTPFSDLGKLLIDADKKAKALAKFRLEQIATTKYMLQQAHDLMTGNTPVGPPDTSENKKALDDIKDFADGFKSILENIVEFNKKSLNIDVTPLQKDLNEAWNEYNKFFTQIIDLREKDQKDVDKYADDVAAKLKKKEISPDEAIKGMEQVRAARKQITDKSNEDLLQAENAYQVNVAAIQDKYRKEAEKKRQEQANKDFAEGLANAKRLRDEVQKTAEGNLNDQLANAKSDQLDNDTLKNRKAVLKAQYGLDVQQLNDAHANGLKSEAVYQEELKALKKKYHDDSEAADKSSLDKAIGEVEKYVGDAEKLIGGIVDLRKTTELNALQAVEDAQQKNYAAQVKRINSSTTSEENKAARLKQLDAERQIQTDQNERRKRQIEQESAKFHKAESIASIILNTAKGVSAAIPNPLLIAIAAATGLAELAIASATPIPQYGFGEEDHPGGLAILGDRGEPEVIEEPGKKPRLSPSVPTIMNLAKHTKVIPLEKIEEIRQSSIMVNPFGQLVGMRDNDVVKEIREMKQAFIWSVMENKKNNSRNHGKIPPVKVDLKWEYYIYKSVKS